MSSYMLRYWCRVVRCAAVDTLGFFGWNRRSIVVPLLAAAGAAVHYRRFGWDAVMDELNVVVSYTLVPVGAFTVLLLLWNLVAVPARLGREAAATRARLSGQLEARRKLSVSIQVERLGPTGYSFSPERDQTSPVPVVWLIGCRITNRAPARALNLDLTLRLSLTDNPSGETEMVLRQVYSRFMTPIVKEPNKLM